MHRSCRMKKYGFCNCERCIKRVALNIKRAYNQKKYTDLQEDFVIMMKKKATTLLAVLLMGAIALTGCSAPHTVNGSAEAVSVNGTSVPLGELNFYLRYQQIYMQNAYGGLFGENL